MTKKIWKFIEFNKRSSDRHTSHGQAAANQLQHIKRQITVSLESYHLCYETERYFQTSPFSTILCYNSYITKLAQSRLRKICRSWYHVDRK